VPDFHRFVDLERHAEIIGRDDQVPVTTAFRPDTIALRPETSAFRPETIALRAETSAFRLQRAISRRSRRK
jgi:hypothetical protein